jgi:hypothetical protein
VHHGDYSGNAPETAAASWKRIADQLGDLELELSYSVEASADLGLLVPSLRAGASTTPCTNQ